MTGTGVQFAEHILNHRWTPTIEGRPNDVPHPTVVRESDADKRRMDDAREDHAMIQNGSVSTIEPRSLGWSEERKVTHVTVMLRTTESRERLWGHRDADNDSERYGGLTGETKRVFDAVRDRHKEYDLVKSTEVSDLSSEYAGRWVAAFELELDNRVDTINPSENL